MRARAVGARMMTPYPLELPTLCLACTGPYPEQSRLRKASNLARIWLSVGEHVICGPVGGLSHVWSSSRTLKPNPYLSDMRIL